MYRSQDGRVKLGRFVTGRYGEVALTPREVETLSHVLKGKTLTRVAEAMAISPRTAEYYFLTIKRKIGFRTKSELITWLIKKDFMKSLP